MNTVICDTGIANGDKTKLIIPSPYYAEATSYETKPGCWNYNKVNIIERETKKIIGSYERNYSSMYRTFHPFELKGKWFALYSPKYTATRIMSLPDCKDIGGETPDGFGFCPTDFYVPVLYYIKFVHDIGCSQTPCSCNVGHLQGCALDVPNPKIMSNGGYDWDSCICKEYRANWHSSHYVWKFPERVHGFVAGCVWGDDSSWKIQHLDLSKADEGIIIRSSRFGYLELPDENNLCDAIKINCEDPEEFPDYISLKIASAEYYDIITGNKYE